MTRTSGGWVVYARQDGRFVFLSKRLETKQEAERERVKLNARPDYRRMAIGVGFVR
jgi:hypothetical protein